MSTSTRELFLRWREQRAPADLAVVFERTAPELLRVAVHLVGDAAAAEDLVQSTFLTALEKAETFDGARELEPWLVGILQLHAHDVLRAARRKPDVERLVERVQARPDDELIARELSAELARAIDELPEPYRQTLLLRARHGLGSADIAHVLGESAVTVRVRIHRGLEKLRRALPAGIALGVLATLEPARGMDAVKDVVLAHAGGSAATAAAGFGGVLVGKKLVAALLVLLLATLIGWRALSESRAKAVTVTTEVASLELAPSATNATPELESAATEVPRTATSASLASVSSGPPVRGRVLDGVSGAPIAGARVRLYAPEWLTLAEIEIRCPRRTTALQSWTSPADDCPWIEEPLDDLAKAGRARVSVQLPPLASAAPIAEVMSDANGAFVMPDGTPWGFLVCTHEGHADRLLPARRTKPVIDVVDGRQRQQKLPHESVVVRMWPWQEITGRVAALDGSAIEREIPLQFVGSRDGGDRTAVGEIGMYDPSTVGSWTVRTDEHGKFRVRVAARSLQVHSLDDEWMLAHSGTHPTLHESYVFQTSFSLPVAQPVELFVQRAPALRVRDAATNAPIEDFQLLSRSVNEGYPFYCGRFLAPRGVLWLTDEQALMSQLRFPGNGPSELFVWAEGHAFARAKLADLNALTTLDLALERGAAPSVHGRVVRGRERLAGWTVSLVAVSNIQWNGDESWLVDVGTTHMDGAFELRGPPGDYVLRCRGDGPTHFRRVTIPVADDIVVDLAAVGTLVVHVADSNGAPRAGHNVVVQSTRGRTLHGDTAASGEVRFESLEAGAYDLITSFKATHGPFHIDAREHVELAPGDTREVSFTLPAPAPRYPRLVVAGGAADGWKAHATPQPAAETVWLPVEANGRIPIDVQFGMSAIDITRDSATFWRFPIPRDAPDGFELRVETPETGYVGTLIDATTNAPLARVLVHAVSLDIERSAKPLVITTFADTDGRFEFALPAGRWRFDLGVDWDSVRRPRRTDPVAWDYGIPLAFEPAEPPAAPHRVLALRVPKPPLETLHGRARRAGAPVADVLVSARAFVDADGGRFVLKTDDTTSTDADGRFELPHARAERVELKFWSPAERRTLGTIVRELAPAAAGDIEIELP